jgi:ArsR family transcriptional regulator
MKKDCFSDKNKINKYSDLAKFMRIVGDDNRLRILCLLKDGEKCVCEIYSNLNMSQNLTSSHLKVLLDFELISIRQEWKRNYYSINKKVFKKYNLLLKNFLKNYEK